ncbi:MAG: response regulator transcription factor [Desulfobacterales bacterium]
MADLLLCSADAGILKRWEGFLAEHHSVNQATSIEETADKCRKGTYRLILLHRPLVDIAAVLQLKQSFPKNRFFIFSDLPNEEEGLTFLKCGIVGYANTFMSEARLIEAVRTVSNGTVWVGQKIMRRLISSVADNEGRLSISDRFGLTQREHEIAGLVASGRTNLEIAADLDISERTVKAHLTSIYEKTGTGNRLNLALLINKSSENVPAN